MALRHHLEQLVFDVAKASVLFVRTIGHSVMSTQARQLRFCRRRGRKLAASYTRRGMFKRIEKETLVLIDVVNGNFLVGHDPVALNELFELNYGARRLRYLHTIRRSDRTK